MRRALLGALLLCATTALLLPGVALARPSALIVLVPGPPNAPAGPDANLGRPDPLLRALDVMPGLAVGLSGATQGNYSNDQAVLDLTQGARISPTAYKPNLPEPLALVPQGDGGTISGWDKANRRAKDTPANLRPGLLAAKVGGAGYVGYAGGPTLDAAIAADRGGHVDAVSIGPVTTLEARIAASLQRKRLVVADLPGGSARPGSIVDRLLAARRPDEMLIVLQRPPNRNVLQLLPIGIAGAIGGAGLTSDTTRRDGVIASIDVLPTVLHHLGIGDKPSGVTGERIKGAKHVSPHALERLRERYAHIAPRRIRALGLLIISWGVILAGFALVGQRRRGLRLAALGFLWVPVVVLVPGAIDPARGITEAGMVVGGSFVLALLTDLFVRWPLAPAVPAVVTIIVFLADLAAGSSLITLSMLGPNPRAGARFFGIGNELEPTLPILAFLGLAAILGAREKSRATAAAFGVTGVGMGLMIGSGLLGADVGGVITASIGGAVAAMVMLPNPIPRKYAVVAAIAAPALALGVLALLDLVSGANSHFTRQVLEAHDGSNLWDVVSRRYDFAYHALVRGKMPVVVAVCIAAVAVGVWKRATLYADLPGPGWQAALIGSLAAGIGGALTNDSGPLLFVVAVFMLAVATAYLLGRPERTDNRPATDPAVGHDARMVVGAR